MLLFLVMLNESDLEMIQPYPLSLIKKKSGETSNKLHVISSITVLLNSTQAEVMKQKCWAEKSRYLIVFVPLIEGIIISGFKLHFRGIIKMAACLCDKNRNFGQWNRIMESHINTHCCSNWISKEKPKIPGGEKIASSTDGFGQTAKLYVEEWDWTVPSLCIKFSPMGIKYLSIRPDPWIWWRRK